MEKIKIEYKENLVKDSNKEVKILISFIVFLLILIVCGIILIINDNIIGAFMLLGAFIFFMIGLFIGDRETSADKERSDIVKKTIEDYGFKGADRFGIFYKKEGKLLSVDDNLDHLVVTLIEYNDIKSMKIISSPSNIEKYINNDPSISNYLLGGALTGGLAGALVVGVIESTIEEFRGEKEIKLKIGIKYYLNNGEIIDDYIYREKIKISALQRIAKTVINQCIRFIDEVSGKYSLVNEQNDLLSDIQKHKTSTNIQCPQGCGELKMWEGKPRCWKCGWTEIS